MAKRKKRKGTRRKSSGGAAGKKALGKLKSIRSILKR